MQTFNEQPKSVFDKLHTPKKKFEEDIPNSVHREIAVALQQGMDKLLGDSLTLIETLGLPDKQEKALKSQFRKAFNERYFATTEYLIQIPFALMELLTPNQANSLSMYMINQNDKITGYADFGRIDMS